MTMNQEWAVEAVRVTAFTGAVADNVGDWFENCLGVTPDVTEFRRAEGLRIDTGVVDRHRYTLQVMPDRIDWKIAAEILVEEEVLNGLGSPSSSLSLINPISSWINTVPHVSRVALGTIAKLRTENKLCSYELLAKYLPALKIDPAESLELSYKINRPRKISIKGYDDVLNRLSSWGAVRVQKIQFGVPSESDRSPAEHSSSHWIRCELDISTVAGREQDIAQEARVILLNMLRQNALEIFEHGDIK